MLQEQPKPPEPPWSECFTVSTPALAASVGSGDGPADIWLAQSGRQEFRLHSKLTFTGVTGRYFRFMLEAVGMSWLRRRMRWAAVAFRTTRPGIA